MSQGMVRPAIVLAVVAFAGSAHGSELPRSMGMYTAHGTSLAMLDSKVEVHVRGPIVEAVVVQTFRNDTELATEATYIFPLPVDAAVSAMAIKTGTRTIHAAIEKREQAQDRYEHAVAAGLGAGLLDQERPDVFTQTVSAIPARGTVEVTLRFDTTARYQTGTWELVLPMVVAPRYVPGTASGTATTGSGRAPDTDRAPDASRVTPAAAPGAGGSTAVAIHFIDPRALETGIMSASVPTGESPPGLAVMPGTALAIPASQAEGIAVVTGGHAFGAVDAEKALRQVVAESEAYYLVGYSPDQPKSGERKVKVRVRREGVKVVSRSRYFVPAESAKPAPAEATAAQAAMRAVSDTTDLPLRAATLFFEANKKGEVATMLATEVVPPAGQPGERPFKLVTEARARDGGAPVWDQFEGSPKVRPGVPVILARQWYLPPGVWQVRLVVEDTATGRIGTLRHTFEVPDPKAFRLSTPILTAELEDPAGKKKPKVALGRTFATGSTLYCQYNVYGAQAAGKHEGALRALGGWALRRGDVLVREAPLTLIQPGGDGRLTRTLGLSLQGASPGEYSLTLVVKNEVTGETLQHGEAFTVGP